jgi:hypothetical protein
MDPDANLKEQLELAECINLCQDRGEKCSQVDAARLAELVAELNEWLLKAGAFPAAWYEPFIGSRFP